MTLKQLKRHMDRRFDRLQRTKADKADLARFATADDLAALKRDIAKMATAAEMGRRFESLSDKIDSVLRFSREKYGEHTQTLQHHRAILDEHDDRIAELERPPRKGDTIADA